MAQQNFQQIDDITREYFFNDGVHDHVLTFKQDVNTDKYQFEEFSNLDLHLDFSLNPLSIIICKKLKEINNIKLVYREIESFTNNFPETDKGINTNDLYKNVISQISKMSREEFSKTITSLENMKFVLKTGGTHYRAIGVNVNQTLDQVI